MKYLFLILLLSGCVKYEEHETLKIKTVYQECVNVCPRGVKAVNPEAYGGSPQCECQK